MDISSVLEKTKKAIKDGLIILILLMLVIVTLTLIDTDRLTVIHKFHVPEKLSKTGLDGEAVSRIVYGKIQKIYQESQTSHSVNVEGYADNVEHTIEFEGIDFNKVVRAINALLGKEISIISGAIYEDGNRLHAVISIDGVESRKITGQADALGNFLDQISMGVVEAAEPYILARYLSTSEGFKNPKIIDLIYECLSNENLEDDYWALNLWGNFFYDEGRFAEAAAKYQEAYDLARLRGVDFHVALANLGAAQAGLGNTEQARKTLETAIEHNDRYYYPYYTLGVINIREGEYEQARKNLDKSLHLNRTNPGSYYHLSRSYWLDTQALEQAMRYAIISRKIYRERGLVRYARRSQGWIQRICEESIDDTSQYAECNN